MNCINANDMHRFLHNCRKKVAKRVAEPHSSLYLKRLHNNAKVAQKRIYGTHLCKKRAMLHKTTSPVTVISGNYLLIYITVAESEEVQN